MGERDDVLAALVSPPRRTVRGRIAEVRTGGDDDEGFGPPEEQILVWRDGPCLRVDSSHGAPIFRSDGKTAWDFRRDAAMPRARPVDDRRGMPYFGPHQVILSRSRLDWLAGDDFTTPAGPVTSEMFAGRLCVTVELAPPPRKPEPLRIWVDVETGQMLGYRNEAAGIGAEFVEFSAGELLDPAMFRWEGRSITQEQEQERLRERSRALAAEQQEWFRQNVTSAPVRARVHVDFTPEVVHRRDPETGAFDASSTEGRTYLARRPRGAEQWTPDWGSVSAYVWSTADWDWAAGLAYHHLDEAAVVSLHGALHPGEPVDRFRRLS